MRLPVRLTRYAVEDLLAIGEWYQSKKAGLDQQFIDTFEIALNFISEHPTLYQVQVRGLRAVLVSRFPYRVFYKVYSDHVIIFGVLHTKRSLKAITRRK